jgi:hypothetical protein
MFCVLQEAVGRNFLMRRDFMLRISFVKMASILALIFASECMSAQVTYIVGDCKKGTTFPTISAALAAAPAANTIEVCPGTYPEQVVITNGVTLEGIGSRNADQAIIMPPSSGLVVNAMDDMGDPVAAQVWVNVAPGPPIIPSISNITIDGTSNGVGGSSGGSSSSGLPTYIAGIFVQNSSATIDHVTARNQSGNGYGIGIWAEGGSSNPTVTVENSSIHGFDNTGANGETRPNETISLNFTKLAVNVSPQTGSGGAGIQIYGPVVAMVENNKVTQPIDFTSSVISIFAGSGAMGSISNNILVLGATGIEVDAAGVAVNDNQIFDASTGVLLDSNPTVQSNTIVGSQVAIEFNCLDDASVSSNTITDAATALDQLPAGVASANTYFDVATEVSNCTTAP